MDHTAFLDYQWCNNLQTLLLHSYIKYVKYNIINGRGNLYTTFVDLTKAFNTISRDGLRKILAKYGCQEKFTSIVWQFHDGMRAHVQDNGDISEAFAVTNMVEQGSVLAPILVCSMFSAMLQDAFHHSEDGIGIIYQTDGKLHNQHHLKAVTKVKQTVIRLPVCWWLWSKNNQWVQHAGQSGQILHSLWQFHLIISTKQNWGYVPTSSWHTLSLALHNC